MTTRANPVLQQWRLLVGVAISAFFVVWMLRQVSDFGAVGTALRDANYLYLLPALAAYFFGVWIRSARWHFLLKPITSIAPNRLFPVVVIGYMANDVLPARLGEFVRAYVLGEQERLPKAAVLGTIVVERTLDGIAMLLFVAVAALFMPPLNPELQSVFQIAALVFVGAIAAFLVVASSSRLALGLVDLVTRPLPERLRVVVKALADRFLAGFHVLRSARLTLAALGLSLAAWLAEAAMYLLIGIGFGLNLPPGGYVLTTAFANLFAMIPSAPGYVGPFDAGAFASLALFGLSSNSVAAYVLVLHIALLVPVTVLGFFFLWRYGLSLRSLWSSKKQSEG